jgi:YebC/PmpR family DNA-binding regulatory protein
MSGHSHWSTIKHKKELLDKKRGKIFSKLSRLISVAAQKGADPEKNPNLRLVIEKAKEFNMPKETVERAILRGSGQIKDESQLSEVIYGACGPGNVSIIIEGITDNKNRALGEIKKILNQYEAKMVDLGAVQWLFEKKGVINLNQKEQEGNLQNKETIELVIIESGAENFYWKTNSELEIYTKPENLQEVKEKLIKSGLKIQEAELGWVPKEKIKVSDSEKEKLLKLFEALDESDEIQNIFSNLAD